MSDIKEDLNLSQMDGTSNCYVITSRSAGDNSLGFNKGLQIFKNSSNNKILGKDNFQKEIPVMEYYRGEEEEAEGEREDEGREPLPMGSETILKNFLPDESDAEDDEDDIIDFNLEGYDLNKRHRRSDELHSELIKYQEELRQYKDTTQELENKYKKINTELCEMQEKHQRFMKEHERHGVSPSLRDDETYSDNTSTGTTTTDSDISLQRKSTQIFHRGSSFMQVVPQERYLVGDVDSYNWDRDKENRPPLKSPYQNRRDDRISKAKSYLTPAAPPKMSSASIAPPVALLQNTINSLQSEQQQFRSIIEQQQNCLQDYHSRCVRAQRVMKTQQREIEKLNTNNHHLESEITHGFEQLRHKIEAKLRDLSQLPQLMKEEKSKNDRISRENRILNDRIRSIQIEATQMKKKIDEISKRKLATMARLKTAERDLKIFRNYNTALKHEKRKLNEELSKLRDQMHTLENSNKRSITRQREQSEKLKRDLQKRIFELELKLSRSQTSANSLVQERDALIAELQTQLNNLVHNFEISQKHIRILRRHIYNMSAGGGSNSRDAIARNRILVETS
ncbi:coiled-coil domain-containing protein 158 [Musca vetustissima]|uniref:coiled-coil domain-containing protein 158 n=1 Tax=Musca vetustissima TaxID=27455 RepID=UPI002AB65611|nr:coiled-coil domain-containing protein 158 [Musca vetustissima]